MEIYANKVHNFLYLVYILLYSLNILNKITDVKLNNKNIKMTMLIIKDIDFAISQFIKINDKIKIITSIVWKIINVVSKHSVFCLLQQQQMQIPILLIIS